MPFQISALSEASFEPLFHLSDDQLKAHGALRTHATQKPGFPCRISLADAEIGEEVLLVHYEHQSAATPFRASHAVYVRVGASQAKPGRGEVPAVFRTRILSLRGFDRSGMMIAADLADGRELEPALEQMLSHAKVDYIHLHYAKPGCFAARVDRVDRN